MGFFLGELCYTTSVAVAHPGGEGVGGLPKGGGY